MSRLIVLTLGVFAMAAAVWAQESTDEEVASSETVAEAESFEGLTEEELEDLDLDNQEDHTEEDEDVFKPTDAVSYQQSVQFPVDI